MLKRLFVLLLIVNAAPAAAREPGPKLLEGHDFTTGAYVLFGTVWGRERHEMQEKLGNFFVEDIALLQEIQRAWVAGGPAPFYACGYHYTVYVLRDRNIVDSFSINLETGCGSVVTGKGSYFFDPRLLVRFADRYRKPVIEEMKYENLGQARRALASLAGNPRLLLQPMPAWRDFDGEFRFMAPCPDHGFDDNKVGACLDRVRSEISAAHPGEPFSLEETGGDGENILVEMKCRKALRLRFELYEDYFRWRDYEPRMTLYWKAN